MQTDDKEMKHIILLLTILLGLSVDCWAQYQINYLSSTSSTITLRSVGYAKNKKLALRDAELSALKAILFQGIDNAKNSTAMISNKESEIMKQHKDYFNRLYKSGYKRFISSSEIVKPFSKDINKRKNIVINIAVNVRALREDLERNGVIRKFGL